MEDGLASRPEKRRHSDRWGTRRICFVFVVVIIAMRMLQTMLSESVMVLRGTTAATAKVEAAKPLGAGVIAALHLLRSSHKKRAGLFNEWPERTLAVCATCTGFSAGATARARSLRGRQTIILSFLHGPLTTHQLNRTEHCAAATLVCGTDVKRRISCPGCWCGRYIIVDAKNGLGNRRVNFEPLPPTSAHPALCSHTHELASQVASAGLGHVRRRGAQQVRRPLACPRRLLRSGQRPPAQHVQYRSAGRYSSCGSRTCTATAPSAASSRRHCRRASLLQTAA